MFLRRFKIPVIDIPLLADDDSSSDEMDIEQIAAEYGDIEQHVNFDTVTQFQAIKMEDVVEDLASEMRAITIKDDKKKKKYGPDQIEHFIHLLQEEELLVTEAAKQCMIQRSSAYKLLDEYNAGEGSVLTGSTPMQRKGEPKKLFSEHSTFFIKLFDDNPPMVLESAREELCKNFEGLSISIPDLFKHMREKCALSLKQASKYTVERDAPRKIELRCSIVDQRKAAGVDFQKNCVSADESGFHSQMIRGRAPSECEGAYSEGYKYKYCRVYFSFWYYKFFGG